MFKYILVFLFALYQNISSAQQPAGIHTAWDSLLQKHVTPQGIVDYKGFIQDSVLLNNYLNTLSANPPDETSWGKNEQMAFWINAYNAFTVQLIIRNYPLKSIKDIGGSVYRVNTTWDIKFIIIGNETLDLNNIEHQKLRKQFDEARIHFAVVCASKSCPILMNTAYTGENLEAQLNTAGKVFLADNYRNQVDAQNPKLSMLFKWYKMDFTKDTSIINYINQFSNVQISEDASIEYLEYDWGLNEAQE
ncbi:MAG: DUF547 domain-containing protein [Chitinophagales bacterium]